MVTHSEMWHRYVPESGNWHDGTFTRWIAALSAAPNSCCHKKYSLRHPRYGVSVSNNLATAIEDDNNINNSIF
jgi:hypothetical protein